MTQAKQMRLEGLAAMLPVRGFSVRLTRTNRTLTVMRDSGGLTADGMTTAKPTSNDVSLYGLSSEIRPLSIMAGDILLEIDGTTSWLVAYVDAAPMSPIVEILASETDVVP